MTRALLLLLFLPGIAGAWTLNERCEIARESQKGVVSVARAGEGGILLYLPEGLVANDARVRVGIGNRTWRLRVLGGAVELERGVEPFLESNWMTVHADDEHLFGLNLAGSTSAWEKLEDCEPKAAGGWLTLSGDITDATDDEIISAIRRRRPEGLVLDSPGGRAEEAQRIGRAVRAAGMATKVESAGQCLSECLFVLAAGAPRTVEAGGRVGMAPILVTRGLGVFRAGDSSVADTAVYFDGMGVEGGALAVLATTAAGPDLRTFTPGELRRLKLTDNEPPAEAARPLLGDPSDWGEDAWWWLTGLLGLGAVFWGVSKVWARV